MSPATPPSTLPVSREGWALLCRRLRLSAREAQIARCVIEDAKESAIADNLRISPHTVHTHMERLYEKLHVASRVQLVVLLVRRYLELTTEADSPLPPFCARRTAGRCPDPDRSPRPGAPECSGEAPGSPA